MNLLGRLCFDLESVPILPIDESLIFLYDLWKISLCISIIIIATFAVKLHNSSS